MQIQPTSFASSSTSQISCQKATVIYNPTAGTANLTALIPQVVHTWQSRGWEVSIQPTAYVGHARLLAQTAADKGFDLVFSAGGDGTIGEVADGLIGSETILALLPAGTGNSLAKEWHLPFATAWHPQRLLQAANYLAGGRIHRVDVGQCQLGHHWLLWAGVGLDSHLVSHIEPRTKWMKKWGGLGYLLKGLWLTLSYPRRRIRVIIDGQTFEDISLLAAILNSQRFAGGELVLNPTGQMDDGQFEVCMVRGHGIGAALTMIVKARAGKHLQDPNLTILPAHQITIEVHPRLPIQLDGDNAGTTPLHCQIKPQALRLLVPSTAPTYLFKNAGIPLYN